MQLDDVWLKTLAIELSAAMPPSPSKQSPAWPGLGMSSKDKAIRIIEWIARNRGWQIEIVRALDQAGAPYIEMLSDVEIFALRDRMEKLEDCLQYGCDPADSPPAL